DPAQHVASRRRYPRYAVGPIDIRVNLAADVLQLIELRYRFALVVHVQMSDFLESLEIPEIERGRAIAHDQPLAVLGDAPAFSRVVEGTDLPERRAVIHEADLGLPGQLNQVVLPKNKSFAEVGARQIHALKHSPRSQLHFP